jgi:hypothetical protein
MSYKAYVRNGKSAIPVCGKRPANGIMAWGEYCNRLPTEEEMEAWDRIAVNATGLALMMGPVSNLACIDIDCTDPDIIDQFRKMLPPGSRKVGKKGFTQFFRISSPNSEPYPITSDKFKKGDNQLVEVFTNNRLIVIPPSAHPDGGCYEWENEPLTPEFDIDYLPVLGKEEMEIIAMIMKMTTMADVRSNVTVGAMRYNDMAHLASELIHKRTPVEEAVKRLVEHDISRNDGKRYFLDKSKGHRTNSEVINAYKYYSDMLSFVNSKKRPEEMELPFQHDIMVDKSKIIWGIPKEVQYTPTVKNLPASLIPLPWRAWILMASNTTGVNPEMIFYPALAALSSLIGNKVKITPKKRDKAWYLSANIWILMLALSGRKKSPSLKVALHEVHKLQRQLTQEKREDDKNGDVKKIKIQEVKTRLSQAIHDKKLPHEIEKIQQEYNAAKSDLKNRSPQLIVNTATPEAMIDIMADSPSGILCIEEELGGLHLKFQKKGYELLRDLLIKSWDGNNSYTYNTKMHGNITIDELCTSMIMAGQPSVFRRISDGVIEGKVGDDGFIQRSIIVFDDNKYHDVLDIEFRYDDYDEAYKIFRKAFEFPNNKKEIRLSDEAYLTLIDFLKYIETKVVTETNETLSSFWGKFRGNAVKVAFLFEYIKANGNMPEVVSVESMNESIEIMKLNEIYINETFNYANYVNRKYLANLIDMLKTGQIADKSSMADIGKHLGVKDSPTIRMLLEHLEALDWLRLVNDTHMVLRILKNPLIAGLTI